MKEHRKILVFLKEHRKLTVFLIFCAAVLVFALARYFNGYAFRNRELFARITDVTDQACIKKTKLEVTPAAGTTQRDAPHILEYLDKPGKCE